MKNIRLYHIVHEELHAPTIEPYSVGLSCTHFEKRISIFTACVTQHTLWNNPFPGIIGTLLRPTITTTTDTSPSGASGVSYLAHSSLLAVTTVGYGLRITGYITLGGDKTITLHFSSTAGKRPRHRHLLGLKFSVTSLGKRTYWQRERDLACGQNQGWGFVSPPVPSSVIDDLQHHPCQFSCVASDTSGRDNCNGENRKL